AGVTTCLVSTISVQYDQPKAGSGQRRVHIAAASASGTTILRTVGFRAARGTRPRLRPQRLCGAMCSSRAATDAAPHAAGGDQLSCRRSIYPSALAQPVCAWKGPRRRGRHSLPILLRLYDRQGAEERGEDIEDVSRGGLVQDSEPMDEACLVV